MFARPGRLSDSSSSNHFGQSIYQRCEYHVKGYTHDTATVEQSKVYSACIRILRPDEKPKYETMDIVLGSAWVLIFVAMLGTLALVFVILRDLYRDSKAQRAEAQKGQA